MSTGKDTPHSALFSLARSIQWMENSIAEHHHQIDSLSTSLGRSKNDYNLIQNQLAPISSLPNEMLSAIFEAGCVLPPSGSSECPFEILISQISHRWRHVAINTPGLWTKISLKAIALRSCVDMATIYIQRSKVSALDIFIRIDKEAYYTPSDTAFVDLASVCCLIIPHVERWDRIHVVCNWQQGFHFFLDQLPAVAPRLRCMKIHRRLDNDDSGDEYVGDIPRRIFSHGAPRLTWILLNGVTLYSCLPPLTAVTHLQLHEMPVHADTIRFRSMFSDLSALTHLVISTDLYVEWAELESIELPSLRSLHIRPCEDDDLIPGLFTAIAAPSLQSLLLELLVPHEAEFLAYNLPDTKFPLLCSLTILQFESDIPHSTWQMLIRAFPAVTHFTLSSSIIDTLCESLGGQYPLLPRDTVPLWCQLHTLTLLGLPSDITILCDMLSARIASSHPIRKLQLSESMMSADNLEYLRAHIEVEESTLYPELARGYFVDWPEGGAGFLVDDSP